MAVMIGAAISARAADGQRPNMVFILADDKCC
jgi:hypothetical protein